jgi:hypothetical protein
MTIGFIPPTAPPVLGRPVFDIREIDHRADLVWFSRHAAAREALESRGGERSHGYQ